MIYRQVEDFDAWRIEARQLLSRRVPPEQISWQMGCQSSLIFSGDEESLDQYPIKESQPTINKQFFQLAKFAACYRHRNLSDDQKWALFYRLAWRLVFENPKLLSNKIDEDVVAINSMRKEVGRDIHKMEAFVRFQQVQRDKTDDSDTEFYLAWFEPSHLIVPLCAPFFVKRFTNMRWSILTPDCCAHWNGNELQLTKGMDRRAANMANRDQLEKLWLVYYANIFNPARLKLKAMQSEMPKKYWKNLPEAALIKQLSSGSSRSMENMISDSQSPEYEKTAKSKFIAEQQSRLRAKRSESK